MDADKKLAEEVWLKTREALDSEARDIIYEAIEEVGERRYREGVEAMRELVAAHEAYEKLLIEELGDFAGFAYAHGIHSTRVEAGEKCRERIEAARLLAEAKEGEK